tara:strand:+ start:75 stop:500 length:426 start_codon:yes stop_codon:yes gene_type:complete
MNKITTERHYKITFQNGSTYYGRTTQPGNKRYNDHLTKARKGKQSNKYIQEVYDKYGSDDWIHEWLGTEIGDKHHHDRIEFGYVQADPKSLNIKDGRRVLNKKEYDWQNHLKRQNARTPEEHEEHNRKQREYYQKNKQKRL